MVAGAKPAETFRKGAKKPSIYFPVIAEQNSAALTKLPELCGCFRGQSRCTKRAIYPTRLRDEKSS